MHLRTCRFNAVIAPVTSYICECLPEGTRETKMGELAYEDLEKLQPEEIMRVCEWLTDKVRGNPRAACSSLPS